jgi:RimJ/RimL family protein N-acetyltransferase
MIINPTPKGKHIATTQRLWLHEFTLDDAEFIYELLNTPDWLKYIGDRNIQTLYDARHYLENKTLTSYTKNGFGMWCVRLHTGQAVGMCGLLQRPDFIDIGFAFLPEYHRNGYGREAAAAAIQQAKALNIRQLAAICVSYNAGSVALLGQLGFVFKKNIYMPDDPEELMFFELDTGV